MLGQLVVGGGLEQEAVAVLLGEGVELLEERVLFVGRHLHPTVGAPTGDRLPQIG